LLSTATIPAHAQHAEGNDTIRLGGIIVDGRPYPFVFLPEYELKDRMRNEEERKRLNQLRSRVYATYSYALTAAAIFKKVTADIDTMDRRRDRKKYMKEIDRQLDAAFKQPLKNMSVEQGHVLISLINRQTGDNCYHVIRELKGGVSAVMWQSVGVFFNNNLRRNYDPEGQDKELEMIVRELEASTAYRYQLYLQDELMKKVSKK
jgi:hypothetical protein